MLKYIVDYIKYFFIILVAGVPVSFILWYLLDQNSKSLDIIFANIVLVYFIIALLIKLAFIRRLNARIRPAYMKKYKQFALILSIITICCWLFIYAAVARIQDDSDPAPYFRILLVYILLAAFLAVAF